MGFYEQIAPYYDYIFPAGSEQLNFIMEAAGDPPQKLLDIACGTGEYAISLANKGFEVYAIDLDQEMVRRAQIKAADRNVHVRLLVSDMLQLDRTIDEKFKCIYCIGNSIVHLGSKETILAALMQMKALLCEDGNLVLQIINFDRIFAKGITALPTIINEEVGLEFHRKYKIDAKPGIVYFDTELIIKHENHSKKFNNRISLFPLLSTDLKSMLTTAGFYKVEFYGDFDMKPYNTGESYMLVVKASAGRYTL